MNEIALAEPIAAENIGHLKTNISVEISTRFLEHFSEQLYSSPQKAFEELISNGWDAGADCVDVHISSDLTSPDATMTVFDNGASMDEQGLRDLWHIAFSPKRDQPIQYGRQVVGKFGIGKLATYVLAGHLTYICKASDGVIRRVTMDYGDIDKKADVDKLISQLTLNLFEVSDDELSDALASVVDGEETLKLITGETKVEAPATDIDNSEFGGVPATLKKEKGDTWTLVILSNLKPTGRGLKVGVLKRMLEAALPLHSEMQICVNGERLGSSKLDTKVMKEWVIGPSLTLTDIELGEGDAKETIPISSGDEPYSYIEIPEIGRVTGKVTLYEDKISGGKSDERGASNGFFVNVLGRVVNQSDLSFGAENLSHAAWARFRMTVRADGLNALLNTNREQFRERHALAVFRAFLRKAFNVARQHYDSDTNAEMPDGGDVLVKSLGVLSLAPLRSIVSETLRTQPPIPGLFDETGVGNRESRRNDWRENTAENIGNALKRVKYEKVEDDSFVKFRIADNTIVINKDHPFVTEHSRTKAEKELMRTIAMVNLLSDVYALEAGVEPEKMRSIRDFRDQLMRFRALQRRKSGLHIAQILLSAQHNSLASKQLEKILGDALHYLGYSIRELGKSGEPEGIASAYAFPAERLVPTEEDSEPPVYRFTYDAKSTKHEAAKTGNVSLDGINEHKLRYKADYALVVAPGFEQGALKVRCEQLKITPMNARDLGRLLEYTVEYGAIPLDVLREAFGLYDPDAVTSWVSGLENTLKKNRKLTIDVFLKALDTLKGKVPDVLHPSIISLTCRTALGVLTVTDEDVVRLVRGLAILVPDLVGIDENSRIVVNASPERVAAAVAKQLDKRQSEADDAD